MISLQNKLAKTVAVTQVLCRPGISESIHTDQGLEFDNTSRQILAHKLGIDKKHKSTCHPQANGTVEQLNRMMGEI